MILTLGKSFLTESLTTEINTLQVQALEKLNELKKKTCVGAEFTGWLDWPEQGGFAELQNIRAELAKIDVPYDLIVVVGIGGSYVGSKAIADALRHSYADQMVGRQDKCLPIVYAGQNLSEKALIELLDLLEEHEPIVNVISKSGGTIEPNLAFRIIEENLHKRFGDEASKRILVSTQQEKNYLCELGKKRSYRMFPVPHNIGGRYSVLSSVGLVPLTLAGYDTEQLLYGADMFFASLRADNVADHPVLFYAAFRRLAWKMGKTLDILAYQEPKLATFVEWWKQLFAESEGKEAKGLMPVGMMYSTDLHSLGQYLQEGPACMIETFLKVGPSRDLVERRVRVPADDSGASESLRFLFKRYLAEVDQAAWLASQKAHSQRGVPCLELVLPHLDEYHLGYLIAFFQTACAVSALMLDVNPFNQPGVEVYKKELMSILRK